MHFLHLIRWGNLLIAAGVYTATCVILQLPINTTSLFWSHGAQIVMLLSVMAFGNIHNDLHDLRTDKVIKPDRPLVHGFVSTPMARLYILNTLLLALIAALVVIINQGGTDIFIWLIATVVALWLYNRLFKRLPVVGNIIVAALTASVPILAARLALMHNHLEPHISTKWHMLICMAFLFTFCRELVKDISDYDGDKAAGFQTLPVVVGINRAVAISLVVHMLVFLVFSYLTYPFLSRQPWQPATIPVLFTAASLLFSAGCLLTNHIPAASLALKIGLLPGVLAVYLF
jgi:4-hydroxybenzoate polyprenyltransferase